MATIGLDQSLSNISFYDHIFLENIKKLLKHDGKCDDK